MYDALVSATALLFVIIIFLIIRNIFRHMTGYSFQQKKDDVDKALENTIDNKNEKMNIFHYIFNEKRIKLYLVISISIIIIPFLIIIENKKNLDFAELKLLRMIFFAGLITLSLPCVCIIIFLKKKYIHLITKTKLQRIGCILFIISIFCFILEYNIYDEWDFFPIFSCILFCVSIVMISTLPKKLLEWVRSGE